MMGGGMSKGGLGDGVVDGMGGGMMIGGLGGGGGMGLGGGGMMKSSKGANSSGQIGFGQSTGGFGGPAGGMGGGMSKSGGLGSSPGVGGGLGKSSGGMMGGGVSNGGLGGQGPSMGMTESRGSFGSSPAGMIGADNGFGGGGQRSTADRNIQNNRLAPPGTSYSQGGYGMRSPSSNSYGDLNYIGPDNDFVGSSSQRPTRMSAGELRQSRSSGSFGQNQYDFDEYGQLSVDNFAYNPGRPPVSGSDTRGRGVVDEGRRSLLSGYAERVPRFARSSSVGNNFDFRKKRPDRISNSLGYSVNGQGYDDQYYDTYDRSTQGGYSGQPMVDYQYRSPSQNKFTREQEYSREIGAFSKPKYSPWGHVGESLIDYQYRDSRGSSRSNYDSFGDSRNPRSSSYESYYETSDSKNRNYDTYDDLPDSDYAPRNLSRDELQQRRTNLMEYLEDLEDQEYGGRRITYSGGNRMSNRDLSREKDRVVREFEDMEEIYGDEFDSYY
eukprot:CCRYP_014409-RA/>CCRYP_014409-RA protein AED:0.43 eAED:0.44 QI:26/1/1/1/0/0/2/93/493